MHDLKLIARSNSFRFGKPGLCKQLLSHIKQKNILCKSIIQIKYASTAENFLSVAISQHARIEDRHFVLYLVTKWWILVYI
jgi:hypothetical protein